MSFLSLLYRHGLPPVRSIRVYCTRLLSGEVLVQFQPSRPNAHVVYWMGIDLLNRLKQVRFLPCVKYILRSDLTGKMRDCYSRHSGSSPLSAAKAPSSKSKTLCPLQRQCRCNSMPVPPLLTSKNITQLFRHKIICLFILPWYSKNSSQLQEVLSHESRSP